jgi:hypothetical protein
MAIMLLLAFPIFSRGASLSTLTGTVYVDLDLDGAFDKGDWGVRGDVIQLFDQSGNFVQQSVTDAWGRYSFANVADGTYTVKNTMFSSLGATANVGEVLDAGGHIITDNAVPNSALMQISNIDLANGSIAQGFSRFRISNWRTVRSRKVSISATINIRCNCIRNTS